MARKNTRNTRGKIVNAAWKLFYKQGYEYTTVEEIIDLSGTSKGSFYHYFDGQSAGQFTSQSTVSEMAKLYALCERALLYDWCLCGGKNSLHQYSKRVLPGFLSSFLP